MTLVSPTELASDKSIRVFDCRHDLGDPSRGPAAHAAGHIPGAVHAHVDRDLSSTPDGCNGRHPLPDRTAFVAWLGSVGLTPSDRVVVYDDANGAFAARLWWLLRWVGHARVSLLDGGLRAWNAAGLPLAIGTETFAPSHYRPATSGVGTVNAQQVLANVATGEFLVVDARAASRFAGIGETIDPIGGHITGAVNRPFGLNVDEDGRFLSPTALREAFLGIIDTRRPEDVVHQCGSGVTACHNLFAIELAGLPRSRLYPGSWSEWCADPSRPMERPQP